MSGRDIVIVGAGPASLAAGYELSRQGEKVTVIEMDDVVGGISKTVRREGFIFDVGGHRFFTKIDRVSKLWHDVLGDDFLRRPKLSRIYYNNRFFNYPLRPINTLWGLGLIQSCQALTSFISSKISPYPVEDTFEQWVSNRFGKKLYNIFFKTYTEKVWGIPCDQIEAEWAAQRIKSLSPTSIIKAALFGGGKKMADEFDYPRYGPGQMYEKMANDIWRMGGKVVMNTRVDAFKVKDKKIVSVRTVSKEGHRGIIEGTDFMVTMPITELVKKMDDTVSESVLEAAGSLSYRSLLTVNLMMNRPETFPDTWIYVHSPNVKVGRIQCFKNWSPFMVPGEDVSSLGLEYFCTEGDELWDMSDQALIELGKREIDELSLVDSKTVFDAFVVRCPKTYPVYSRDYSRHVEVLKSFVSQYQNLQCMGRSGMFKYNNMDHSILSGLLAADNILGGSNDLWAINIEDEYHEQKLV